MKKNHDIIDLEGFIKHETELAVLFSDGQREAWLPLSKIEVDHPGNSALATVSLPEWLALEKGLI